MTALILVLFITLMALGIRDQEWCFHPKNSGAGAFKTTPKRRRASRFVRGVDACQYGVRSGNNGHRVKSVCLDINVLLAAGRHPKRQPLTDPDLVWKGCCELGFSADSDWSQECSFRFFWLD